MNYQPIDDSGEFNDSVVYLHPVRLTEQALPLARPSLPQQLNLGVYEGIKLSSLLRAKQGNVVELVTLDVPSRHAFVTEEGEALLRQYATNEVAFVMVAGNRSSGKSFFCDKVLNLCEVRGNHFCRSKNTGINMWSSPFEKEDLKIFLLEINGCPLHSQQFKVLLTYAIMIGSAFVVVDDLKPAQHTALEQFDHTLADIVDQITPSRLQANDREAHKRELFLPEFFYFLRRTQNRKENQALSVVSSFIEERLPDALAAGYQGDAAELIHMPFLDTKCVSQDYIRKVAGIFSQLYEVVTEKRYNELNLTGSIVVKIMKYIEGYLNGSKEINIEELYDRLIEDLYQSAYNYCILSYHEEMERHFEDEQPKSLDQLISVFELASTNVLDKFQEFTLDEKFHQLYRQRLERHIDEKEEMVLDINKLKTQRVIHASYDATNITDYDTYREVVKQLNTSYPNLNHGSAEGLGRVAAELFGKMKGVDYKALKEIERLNTGIEKQGRILGDLREKNQLKSRERSLVNKQQEDLYQSEKRLENRKKDLRTQIQSTKNLPLGEPEDIARQREHLEEAIKRNNATINDLRKADPRRNKDVLAVESKIEETGRNIARLEKILSEIRSNPQGEEVKNAKGKQK